jgi:hypothetical protein
MFTDLCYEALKFGVRRGYGMPTAFRLSHRPVRPEDAEIHGSIRLRYKHRHTVFGQEYNAGTVVGLEDFNSIRSLCIIDVTISPYTEALRATCTYLSRIRKRHRLALEWLGHWTNFTREVSEQQDLDATHPPHLFLYALALQCIRAAGDP